MILSPNLPALEPDSQWCRSGGDVLEVEVVSCYRWCRSGGGVVVVYLVSQCRCRLCHSGGGGVVGSEIPVIILFKDPTVSSHRP